MTAFLFQGVYQAREAQSRPSSNFQDTVFARSGSTREACSRRQALPNHLCKAPAGTASPPSDLPDVRSPKPEKLVLFAPNFAGIAPSISAAPPWTSAGQSIFSPWKQIASILRRFRGPLLRQPSRRFSTKKGHLQPKKRWHLRPTSLWQPGPKLRVSGSRQAEQTAAELWCAVAELHRRMPAEHTRMALECAAQLAGGWRGRGPTGYTAWLGLENLIS